MVKIVVVWLDILVLLNVFVDYSGNVELDCCCDFFCSLGKLKVFVYILMLNFKGWIIIDGILVKYFIFLDLVCLFNILWKNDWFFLR